VVNVAYFDTSALVKQYVTETGSDWTQAYLAASPMVFISSLAVVEATCAFARRLRDGTLTPTSHMTVVEALDYDVAHKYRQLNIVTATVETAKRLATTYPLRAYDAVHLATACLLNEELQGSNQGVLTFVRADDRLIAVAQAEGLMTDNPNAHPS
jgi:predicted nucleic acid-binding protein